VPGPTVGGSRLALTADCARCVGLCCVLPGFVASADFAITKPAGTPCPNLAPDHRCRIHQSLRAKGFPGCTVYDCFGAGQHLVEATGGAEGWPADRAVGQRLSARFPVLRQLHELLWYLDRAVAYLADGAVRDELLGPVAGSVQAERASMATAVAAPANRGTGENDLIGRPPRKENFASGAAARSRSSCCGSDALLTSRVGLISNSSPRWATHAPTRDPRRADPSQRGRRARRDAEATSCPRRPRRSRR